MRKFTKTHNNLEWLFPSPENPSLKESESYFDMYEYQAYNLFEIAHPQLHGTFSKDDVIDALIGLVLSGYLKEEDCECEEENGVEIDTSELNNYTLDEEKFAEGLTDISHLAGMVSGLMSLGLNGENALTGALSLTLAKSDKERDLEIARINA